MVAYSVEVLASESIWTDKFRFANAERQYYESFYKINKEHLLNNLNNRISDEHKSYQLKSSKIKLCRKNESDKKSASKLILKPTENVEKSIVKKKKSKKIKTILNTNIANGGSNLMQNDLNQMNTTKKFKGNTFNNQCTLVSEIAKAREHIKNSLEKMDGIANLASSPVSSEVVERLTAVEKNNEELKNLVEALKGICFDSQKRILELEAQIKNKNIENTKESKKEQEDDDGVDLFASESEDENDDAIRIREERLAAYAAKKSKKPALIAKSSLVLDVKPWDDETDLKNMESEIRKIETDGLLWGASKFLPVAFGIQKLAISCVVEDDKVSIDWLTEEIEKLEDFVQSVDVAAFNKI